MLAYKHSAIRLGLISARCSGTFKLEHSLYLSFTHFEDYFGGLRINMGSKIYSREYIVNKRWIKYFMLAFT